MQSDLKPVDEPTVSGWRAINSAIQLRFRFLLAILALGLLAGIWPWLTNSWERLLARWNPYVQDSTVSAGSEYFCPMDPGVVSVWPAICPICNMDLIRRRKTEMPILPSGVVARMQLSPYRIALAGVRTVAVQERESLSPQGSSPLGSSPLGSSPQGSSPKIELVIPATAVVHWGTEAIVYVESMPGMFDGMAVQLGQREGDSQVVNAGLKPGQSVVAIGTLLVDAETRLHPHLATQYFGAALQATAEPPPPVRRSKVSGETWKSEREQINASDRLLAEAQRYCPVTQAELGSMGAPVFEQISGRRVALCCASCRATLLADPTKYLTWLDERLASEQASK